MLAQSWALRQAACSRQYRATGQEEEGIPLPTRERIEKARLQAEQAKARLQALEARVGEAERKLDTRRKIILGGLLLDAATKDERYAKVVAALLARVERDNDRKAFEGWEAPVPAAAPGPATSPTLNSTPSQL